MSIVEASLVLPITILIIFSMVFLMMGFYNDLLAQTEAHQEAIIMLYE